MKREKAQAGYRLVRLQEILLEELGALIRDDISDPTLRGLRVVSVLLSTDYRHARVHVVGESEAQCDPRGIEEALERASRYLRYRLAVDLDLKRTPELRFICDAVVSPDPEGPP